MNPKDFQGITIPLFILAMVGAVLYPFLKQLGSWLFRKAQPWLERYWKSEFLRNKATRLLKFLWRLVIIALLIMVVRVVDSFPDPEKISGHLLMSEKALLVFVFQTKHKELPSEPVQVQPYLDKLEKLPKQIQESSFWNAAQTLIRYGLVTGQKPPGF